MNWFIRYAGEYCYSVIRSSLRFCGVLVHVQMKYTCVIDGLHSALEEWYLRGYAIRVYPYAVCVIECRGLPRVEHSRELDAVAAAIRPRLHCPNPHRHRVVGHEHVLHSAHERDVDHFAGFNGPNDDLALPDPLHSRRVCIGDCT